MFNVTLNRKITVCYYTCIEVWWFKEPFLKYAPLGANMFGNGTVKFLCPSFLTQCRDDRINMTKGSVSHPWSVWWKKNLKDIFRWTGKTLKNLDSNGCHSLDKVEGRVRLLEGGPRMSRWPILFEWQPLPEGVIGVKVNTGWSFRERIQLKRIVPVWPRVLYKQGKLLILPATVCTYVQAASRGA